MSLPGVRSAASPEQAARLAKRGCLPSVHERARIFLLLAEVITRIGKPQAAADVRKVKPTVGLVKPTEGLCVCALKHPNCGCMGRWLGTNFACRHDGQRPPCATSMHAPLDASPATKLPPMLTFCHLLFYTFSCCKKQCRSLKAPARRCP